MSFQVFQILDSALKGTFGLLGAVIVGAPCGAYHGTKQALKGVFKTSTFGYSGGQFLKSFVEVHGNLIGKVSVAALAYLLSSSLEEDAKINSLITCIFTPLINKKYALKSVAQKLPVIGAILERSSRAFANGVVGFCKGFFAAVSTGCHLGQRTYQVLSFPGRSIGRIVGSFIHMSHTARENQENDLNLRRKTIEHMGAVFLLPVFLFAIQRYAATILTQYE